MSKWNYRVFRCVDPTGSPYYEMREVHYGEGNKVEGWTEGGSAPMGETFRELIGDLAWLLAALSKPILDDKTGLECEPAQMLADDLQRWMDARADTESEA